MVTANTGIVALNGRNAIANQIYWAVKVHLQTILGAANLQQEIDTITYIINRLFDLQCPLTILFTTKLIPFIDQNFVSFERQYCLSKQLKLLRLPPSTISIPTLTNLLLPLKFR